MFGSLRDQCEPGGRCLRHAGLMVTQQVRDTALLIFVRPAVAEADSALVGTHKHADDDLGVVGEPL